MVYGKQGGRTAMRPYEERQGMLLPSCSPSLGTLYAYWVEAENRAKVSQALDEYRICRHSKILTLWPNPVRPALRAAKAPGTINFITA